MKVANILYICTFPFGETHYKSSILQVAHSVIDQGHKYVVLQSLHLAKLYMSKDSIYIYIRFAQSRKWDVFTNCPLFNTTLLS